MALEADQRHSEGNEGQWAGEFDPLSDSEERRVLFAALDSFKQYRKNCHYNVTHRRRQNFYALPSRHWQALAEPPFSYLETLDRVDDAIDENAKLAESILKCGLAAFGLVEEPPEGSMQDWRRKSTAGDAAKAHSTIRQFYRDWSKEGEGERNIIYSPVLQDLHDKFGQHDRTGLRVLVPGAGLGRLVFDLCLAGYSAEGNEISYHQLLASNWILNHTAANEQLALYPFVTQFTNNVSRESQLQRVGIPDVHPATAMGEALQQGEAVGEMSMSAADFLVLYSSPAQKDSFHAVATVFFIDTAPNLIRYIETIRNCLAAGGLWINIGPLLWHFDDRAPNASTDHHHSHAAKDFEGIAEPGSVELTDEEVILLVERFGFKIQKHELVEPPVGYIQNPQSMLQNLYKVSHWVAVKI